MVEDKYATLLAINERKSELQLQLDESSEEIRKQWNELFHAKPVNPQSPTQRFLSIASSSAGLIDGALLGWKLYRKFASKR